MSDRSKQELIEEELGRELESIDVKHFDKADSRIEEDLHHLMEFSESEEEALKKELRGIEELEDNVNTALQLAEDVHKYDQEIADLRDKIEAMLDSEGNIPEELVKQFQNDLEGLKEDLTVMKKYLLDVIQQIYAFKEVSENDQERINQLEDVVHHIGEGYAIISGDEEKGFNIEVSGNSGSTYDLNYTGDGLLGEVESLEENLANLKN